VATKVNEVVDDLQTADDDIAASSNLAQLRNALDDLVGVIRKMRRKQDRMSARIKRLRTRINKG